MKMHSVSSLDIESFKQHNEGTNVASTPFTHAHLIHHFPNVQSDGSFLEAMHFLILVK